MKSDEIIIQMQLNHGAINGALSWFVDNAHQGALYAIYGQKTHKTRNISTIDKATGLKWVSNLQA